jgi:hypothetical protein
MLRYEQLLKDTRSELTRLAAFLGILAERQWLDEVCDLVDPSRLGKRQLGLITASSLRCRRSARQVPVPLICLNRSRQRPRNYPPEGAEEF